jgi:TrmH family RNA methyltransferase
MALPHERTLEVEPKLLADVSELAHAPRVIGIFELPEEREMVFGNGPVVVLDGVGDPGNVGTTVRSAAAFGAGAVVLLPGCADPWSGKAIRASMGSCFRIPLLDDRAIARMLMLDMRFVGLAADGDVSLSDAAIDESTAIIVGGERVGISQNQYELADVIASIPQDPAVESLNAGVAASLALYEWRRSRA